MIVLRGLGSHWKSYFDNPNPQYNGKNNKILIRILILDITEITIKYELET